MDSAIVRFVFYNPRHGKYLCDVVCSLGTSMHTTINSLGQQVPSIYGSVPIPYILPPTLQQTYIRWSADLSMIRPFMERFGDDLHEISPSDDIMTWFGVMDNPGVDGEGRLEFSVAVLDHELPLHDAVLYPFYELIASVYAFELMVQVMSGVVLHSFTMLFNLLDDLNSFITRVYQGKVIDGVFPEWRNAVYAQGCVPEALKPVLYILLHFTRHLLSLISYLSG